jgi:hypothetical protein
VRFAGRWHTVPDAGSSPLPVQRPIPIWFGAESAPAYRRAGRLGDGWFPQMQPGPELDKAREIVDEAAGDAGHDPSSLGMEGRVRWRGGAQDMAERVEKWRATGASHLSIDTMKAGFSDIDEHLRALESLATVLALKGA